MVSVVDAQREILLDPIGTNVWVSTHIVLGHSVLETYLCSVVRSSASELEQRRRHMVACQGALRS